jgi:hypothetical protein
MNATGTLVRLLLMAAPAGPAAAARPEPQRAQGALYLLVAAELPEGPARHICSGERVCICCIIGSIIQEV